MRKVVGLISCISILLLLCGACSWNKEGWKTVKIMEFPMENGTYHEGEVYGTLRIPEDWVFTQDGEHLYFTDRPVDEEECQIYLISFVEDDDENVILKNWNREGLTGKMNTTSTGNSGVCSNGIVYSLRTWNIDEDKNEKWQIAIPNIPILVAWDDLVDQQDIKRIAASFEESPHWREEHR